MPAVARRGPRAAEWGGALLGAAWVVGRAVLPNQVRLRRLAGLAAAAAAGGLRAAALAIPGPPRCLALVVFADPAGWKLEMISSSAQFTCLCSAVRRAEVVVVPRSARTHQAGACLQPPPPTPGRLLSLFEFSARWRRAGRRPSSATITPRGAAGSDQVSRNDAQRSALERAPRSAWRSQPSPVTPMRVGGGEAAGRSVPWSDPGCAALLALVMMLAWCGLHVAPRRAASGMEWDSTWPPRSLLAQPSRSTSRRAFSRHVASLRIERYHHRQVRAAKGEDCQNYADHVPIPVPFICFSR